MDIMFLSYRLPLIDGSGNVVGLEAGSDIRVKALIPCDPDGFRSGHKVAP